jgi:predicted nuclease with TOPRIM domain
MTEAPAPPTDIVLEHLKKIQAGIAQLRNDNVDTRRDIRAMKDELVSVRSIMGEFMKTDARREGDYLHLSARLDRIENRLDLQDHPPA